ncbi:MAG: spore maturation protein [Clostridiales bacterium]|nr:spore maturation protein [Clostridiales bacterium]
MLNLISISITPILLLLIITHGLFKRVNIFSTFTSGAKTGIQTVFNILPTLVAILIAISMFNASGALELLGKLLAPILNIINFPLETLPLAIMRPISGGASLAIVSNILKTTGISSYAGRVASVMMGSTETTFYVIAVYFAAIRIKNMRHTLKAALIADLAGIIASVIVVQFFF